MALKDWGIRDKESYITSWVKENIPTKTPWGTTEMRGTTVQLVYLDSPVQGSYNQHPNEYVVSIITWGKKTKSNFFKTKPKAIAFAKAYMRKH